MLKALFLFAATATLWSFSAAAGTPVDADGVPRIDLHGRIVVTKVPALTPLGQPQRLQDSERRVVTVDGRDMGLREFFNTYCAGKSMTNSTCSRAAKIADLDGLRLRDGKLRPLPAGL